MPIVYTCTPRLFILGTAYVSGCWLDFPSVMRMAIFGIPSDAGRAPRLLLGSRRMAASLRPKAVAVHPPLKFIRLIMLVSESAEV